MKRSVPLLAALYACLCACSHPATESPGSTAASAPPAAQQVATSAPAASGPGAGSPGASAPTATLAAAGASAPASAPGAAQNPADGSDDAPVGTTSLEKLAELPAQHQLPSARWKPGENYDPIVPAQPTAAQAGKVEVLEVFWYACPHCYALEPFIAAWRKTKPAYIDFVRVPVMWGPVHRAHAQLYYTLKQLGRNDLDDKVFDTLHNQQNPLVGDTPEDTLARQLQFARDNGIDADAFRKAYDSFAVNSDLQRAEEITQRYHVEGVPLIVINGKYMTDVGKAGSHDNLIAEINDLAAGEHKR
jgi:protein dithiol oxidoreductase (disulfide-forming)